MNNSGIDGIEKKTAINAIELMAKKIKESAAHGWNKSVDEIANETIAEISGSTNNPIKLLQLINENPDLPIVAMVSGEIVAGDDFCRWIGTFGECRVDEYIIDDWYGDGCVEFKSDADIDTIIEAIAETKYSGTEEGYKKAEKELKTMWTRAIVVNIDLPENIN